ncbi:MAG: hypothetical protein J6Y93_01955 [Treponema sp.]|nr:hypothetical protein [Treponema sp.]
MKKIISAALVASMAAAAVFADAKITLNYRTKLDAFAYCKKSVGSNDTIKQEWLDWEGYDGAGAQAATSPSDTMKFAFSGERAGATFAININTNASTYTLNEYSAWMNFPVGPGTLTLRSGNWKDGYADGNYRVKKDVDAQNAEGMDFERFKLGTIFKGTKRLTFIDDLAAGVAYGNNKGLFSAADYGFNVNDDVNLNVLLGSVYDTYDTVVDDDTTTYYDAFFVSRVQAKVKNVLNAELIYKHPTQHVNDIALYVMPVVTKALTLNVGGAIEMDGTDGADYTDWAFDVRARYAVDDNLSITFFTNVSGTDLEAGRNISAGVVGHKGGEGWATAAKFKTAMWNNLSARYKLSDTLAATLNVGLINALSNVDGDDESYGMEWRVTPAVQVYAASNASIWAGVAISGSSLSDADTSVMSIQVPVIFRVKM